MKNINQIKTLYIASAYVASLVFNTGMHTYDSIWAGMEARKEGWTIGRTIDGSGTIRRTPRGEQLKEFQRHSLDELVDDKWFNPWLLVPGSYFLRRSEKPEDSTPSINYMFAAINSGYQER